MRALLLPDRAFLSRERPMLSRLEVGLADEGVRVFHAVPEGFSWSGPEGGAGDEPAMLFSTLVPYADRGLPLTFALRCRAVLHTIERLAPTENAQKLLDIVHVFGLSALAMGQRLAQRAGAKLVVEVWSAEMGRQASRAVGAGGMLIAADAALTPLLGARHPDQLAVAPWGVHVPSHGHDDELVARGTGPLTCVLLAGGRDGSGVRAAIHGLGELASGELASRGVMVFVDAQTAEALPVWSWASACGLDGRVSIVSHLEARRELALQADVLLLCDASGEQRSFVLDAMASGMLVLARPDAHNGVLIDGRTCRFISANTPEGWREGAASFLGPEHAQTDRALGESARAFVRSERLASGQVARVLEVYERLTRAVPAGGGR